MHSSCSFYLFLFLINYGFFSTFPENSVSALSDKSAKKDGYSLDFIKPIKDAAHSALSLAKRGSNAFVKSIKTAIYSTSHFIPSRKPLTFFTALKETCLVNQTQKSLKVTILNPITVATMTGGPLGNDIFEFEKYFFSWQDGQCDEPHLEAATTYFNLKYGSYDKALNHEDGIAMVNFPISTGGNYSNPKFDKFSELLQCKINGPGSYAKIESDSTYTWFVNFHLDSIYNTYTRPHYDEDSGKTNHALVIEMPSNPLQNFISRKQFDESFSKNSISHGDFHNQDYGSLVKEAHKGIVVLYLPA